MFQEIMKNKTPKPTYDIYLLTSILQFSLFFCYNDINDIHPGPWEYMKVWEFSSAGYLLLCPTYPFCFDPILPENKIIEYNRTCHQICSINVQISAQELSTI